MVFMVIRCSVFKSNCRKMLGKAGTEVLEKTLFLFYNKYAVNTERAGSRKSIACELFDCMCS